MYIEILYSARNSPINIIVCIFQTDPDSGWLLTLHFANGLLRKFPIALMIDTAQ